jgi:2-succinyl-5-enolpyruvyl-6-hydroxy-3-cyclohexene-1-carboxylate synthase
VVGSFLSAAVDGGATDVVVEPWGRWRDPDGSATDVVGADPGLFCRALTDRLARDEGPGPSVGAVSGWLASWDAAESAAQAVIAPLCGDGGGGLTEPALAHRLMARMPERGTLVVSSSMPVRDVEAFAAPRHDPPRVLANRGANGIDGVVSTAVGVALGSPGPTVALVGDLAFLHDASALVRSGPGPDLVVVVADNRGGGIFSFLEAAEALDAASFEEYFATPQASDVAAVAAGFGWPVDQVDDDPAALDEALDARLASGGGSVIRVGLPDRRENVAHHRRINDAITAAVEAGLAATSGGDQQGRGS